MASLPYHIDAERTFTLLYRSASILLRLKHWHWIAFSVITVLALRLALALTHTPYLGIDGGPYLLSALEVMGKDSTSVGFPRPPLAPGWLLVPFIELFGINVGYKLWTTLFSMLTVAPVYLITRDLVNKGAAAFAVAFLCVDMMHMEMMVTGSLPLIGFTFIGLALWSIFRLIERQGEWLHFWALVGSVGILPYINQTATGIAAIVLPLATVAAFVFVRVEKGPGRAGPHQANVIFYVLPAAFLGGLIALGALPWYLANAPGNSELRFPGPLFMLVKFPDPAMVLQAPLVAFLVYWLWKLTNDYRVRTIAVLLAVLGVMILFLSYDEAVINILFRSRYFLALLVYPAFAWLLCRNWPLDWDVKEDWRWFLPMAACWLALLWGQVVIFTLQTDFKDRIYPETLKALEIAKTEHPEKAIITNGYSFSHWVAALNQVESPNLWSIEPSPYYAHTDHRVRCVLGWVHGCIPSKAAKSLGARYVLIDERMPDEISAPPIYGAPSDDEWPHLYHVPWLKLRFSEGTVRLWEIDFTGAYHATPR